MAKRAKFQRKKRQNKYSMLLVTMVVLMLVVRQIADLFDLVQTLFGL